MTEQQRRECWDAARMFLTADGESGKVAGNETIRVDESGRLPIKVPAARTDRFGRHLHIATNGASLFVKRHLTLPPNALERCSFHRRA